MQASTPPRSDNRAVGGVWSFEMAPPLEPEVVETFVLLLLASDVREGRIFLFPLTAGVSVVCVSRMLSVGIKAFSSEGASDIGVDVKDCSMLGVDTGGAGEFRFRRVRR